ncbi:hypothetical protein [Stakelama tenebrarum]|uniref:Uncharacterized protein n=1 Tax=Stakelama tenebrarum TaxID=2711215 RepID=A0A6G6Y995_9SPHN|nr:hypothetical protein [Sphingosinithalassobacter tenebrarum]QIG81512.1 hypothetical protein G5C33_18120 [Sphingosinithalassobacter tenebrarum]
MSKWDYNSVINTLTYLDVSSANAKLRRIENELSRPVRDPVADREGLAYMANFKLEQIFDKLLARDRNMERDGSAREYLETELLTLEVIDHDPEDFDRPNYATKVDHLRQDLLYRRKKLAEKFGPEGQRYVEDLIQLPYLIHKTRQGYVYEAAYQAQKGSWLLGGAGVALYAVGLVLIVIAALMPTIWDGMLLGMMDGNASYFLAPVLMVAGLGVVGATAVLRFLSQARVKAGINAAKKRAGYAGNVALLRGKAAKDRAYYNSSPFGPNTADRHSVPAETQSEKLEAIAVLERQLTEAQRWLEAN